MDAVLPALGPAALGSAVDAARSGELRLPTIPRVVATLIQQMKDPDASIDALVAQLEQDPVLSARAVRLANSAFFSGARSVDSIQDAVITVGVDTLRTLVISCGVMTAFSETPGVNLRDFWASSTRTASVARTLARLSGTAPDAAFLAGLLHLSGHLILCHSFPDAARTLAALPASSDLHELEAREARVFGTSHRAIGAAWLDAMSFPPSTVASVRHYLDRAPGPVERPTLVLALATALAGGITAGLAAAEVARRLDPGLVQALGLDRALAPTAFPALYAKLCEVIPL